jgi:hypothetical protein
MNDKHPITPPPELVEQWRTKYVETRCSFTDLVAEAARWGADQELEACCEWLDKRFQRDPFFSKELCAARRPKPPSLKEQALDELTSAERLYPADWSTIRRALETLDD